MKPLSQRTLQTALTQLGVQEIPKNSNAGADVEKYLKSIGLGKGYSWCMAFVYWCVKTSLLPNETNPLLKTGGVMRMWNERPNLRKTKPMVGDIMILDYGKGLGHTGIVNKLLPNGMIETIEGNTNDEGSREGYEVCLRVREIKKCKGFLRLD